MYRAIVLILLISTILFQPTVALTNNRPGLNQVGERGGFGKQNLDEPGRINTHHFNNLVPRLKSNLIELPNWPMDLTESSQVRTDSVNLGWIDEYAGYSIPSHDQLAGMVTDYLGNVYVTGTSDYQWQTMKYSSAGNLLWSSQYVEEGVIDTYGEDVIIDNAGNVYVSGYRWGPYIDSDVLLIKYDSEGNQLWVSEYDGAASNNDFPATLAMDNSGDIIIGGYGYNSELDADFVTLKYTDSGVLVWESLFNGEAYGNDWIIDMSIDADNNIYVGGVTFGESLGDDLGIVKYTPAGDTVWVAGYASGAGYPDWLTALSIDTLGQVYASGITLNMDGYIDYLILKFNEDGSEAWSETYAGPVDGDNLATDVAVNSKLNVIVTGVSYNTLSGFDYVTIQFDTTGNPTWLSRYTSLLTNGYDEPTNLYIDTADNAFVTGMSESANGTYDFATIKYDTLGGEHWQSHFHSGDGQNDIPLLLEVGSTGDITLAGRAISDGAGENYSLSRLDSSGITIWDAQYNGGGQSHNTGSLLAYDSDHNVIVAGTNFTAEAGEDILLVKYNSLGTTEWVATHNGSANGDEKIFGMVTGPDGNIYLTGSSKTTDTEQDIMTIKYGSDGSELWIAYYDGPEHEEDEGRAITLDSDGNVYVTGYSSGTFTNHDYTTIKYDPSGNEVWVARFVGLNYGTDEAQAIALDGIGNIYVSGSSFRTGMNLDYVTVKYDPLGDELWVTRYNGPTNGNDQVRDLAIDDNGNVFVTGTSPGSGTGLDFATVMYSSEGNQIWVARQDGTANFDDIAEDIELDWAGRPTVSGSSFGSDSGNDFLTIKYSATGEVMWQQRFNGASNLDDTYGAMASDATGSIYITGQTLTISEGSNFETIKYDADGNQLWSETYSGSGYSWDVPEAIAVNLLGTVWLTGTSHYHLLDDNDWSKTVTLQYLQPEFPVATKTYLPLAFNLSQNFPNPFNPMTSIDYSVPEKSHVSLRIFNVLGQEINSIVNREQAAGNYQVNWDGHSRSGLKVNTGIYFCRMEADNYTHTIKMLLLQ